MARWFLRLGAAGLTVSGLYAATRMDPNDIGLVRIGRAVATTAVISYDYIVSLRGLEYGTDEYESIKSQVHRRSAGHLLDLCRANRGTFIKVGQHLGGLDYLLPEEYTSTLKILHSQAPQSSLHDVQQVIQEDLGKEVTQLFASFDEAPLGTASWAQVHKVVLHDGRTVALKVQHPKVQRQCAKDIILMEVLVHSVSWLFPDFSFAWLVDETKKNVPLELDFLKEGHNTEVVAEMFKHFQFLKVPKIHWELSTSRVLAMEFIDGGQVNDREYMRQNGIDVNETLTEEFRLNYCRLWYALIKTDKKAIEKYSRRLGAAELYPLFACMVTGRSWASITKGIDQIPVSKTEDVEIRIKAAKYLSSINELLNNVPRQMLLLLKTNDLLRGIETSLQTRASASSFITMSRCCVRAVSRYKKDASKSWYGRLKISLAEALVLWQISLHEILLWVKASSAWRWVSGDWAHEQPLQ
ncbi:aarF domain-containing protein kinase 1 isoform X2 [Amblyraja radiata]|uniref:aarF domain-containing protein kinase 1 isoform X2 n=1 Tax=Amblyraja radiata TaxID=386614 RepID=UPI00140314E1|nr:aarF domain-containing protein kinase 1 isoform X2 [Amblyraja radiata]